MSPEEIFKDKSVALIVQGILLLVAVVYATHGEPNIWVILCIATLLTLYILQALNHRFRYYFPINTFFQKETRRIDTYLLYGLTFLAFFFFLAGLTHSIILGFCISIIVLSAGPLWRLYGAKLVSSDIESQFKQNDPVVSWIRCPYCGGEAVQVAAFISGNVAIAKGKCLKGCERKFEKGPQMVTFG